MRPLPDHVFEPLAAQMLGLWALALFAAGVLAWLMDRRR